MKSASVYFLLFVALLAFRDVLIELFLTARNGANVPASLMLAVYCATATGLAWLFHVIQAYSPTIRPSRRVERERSINPWRHWIKLSGTQRRRFLKLGIATWVVYAATIWGIGFVGAPVFDLVDYAWMPLLTVLAGAYWVREEIPKRRIVFGIIGCASVALIFWGRPQHGGQHRGYEWATGIFLAVVSTLTTSYCNALQKQQVDDDLEPDEVLLFRFPIPTVLGIVWLAIERPQFDAVALVGLVIVGAVGLFLPLLLLCYGLVQKSLGVFSRYLFLIPVLIWILVPALVSDERARLSDWRILSGAILLVGSYIGSEVLERRNG
jgi:drug/metabolite transporter (DMT)-like permease